jgi:8-oxo-dGTP diphosphatase
MTRSFADCAAEFCDAGRVKSLPLVVGALIVDRFPGPSRVLAARRTRPESLAGQWEFPGGKVEHGETPEDALRREIAEELAVEVSIQAELPPPAGEAWPASNGYVMRLFFATTADQPVPSDGHDAIRWLSTPEFGSVLWLESDRRVLSHLGLDPGDWVR